MGTDIHMFVEKYNSEHGYWEGVAGPNPRVAMYKAWAERDRENGRIEAAEEHEKLAADIASGEALKGITRRWEFDWNAPKVYEGWVYDGRNYDLFAILADVRNGRGFAGVETGEGFNSIDTPRGLPDDISEEVEDYLKEDGGYHSMSYVGLDELIQYDWDQVTTQYGTVSEEEYKVFKEEGEPKHYSGDVWGQNIIKITQQEMEDLIAGKKEREEGKTYYTRVSWHESYRDAVGTYWFDSMDKLKELADNIDGSDVRIVFGFDS